MHIILWTEKTVLKVNYSFKAGPIYQFEIIELIHDVNTLSSEYVLKYINAPIELTSIEMVNTVKMESDIRAIEYFGSNEIFSSVMSKSKKEALFRDFNLLGGTEMVVGFLKIPFQRLPLIRLRGCI